MDLNPDFVAAKLLGRVFDTKDCLHLEVEYESNDAGYLTAEVLMLDPGEGSMCCEFFIVGGRAFRALRGSRHGNEITLYGVVVQ